VCIAPIMSSVGEPCDTRGVKNAVYRCKEALACVPLRAESCCEGTCR
jgi:hypothetical protein